jgi:hypothetical protein
MGHRFVPYAYRVAHKPRHGMRVLARRRPLAFAVSILREAGEFLVGAFQPIRDAV